MDTTKLDKEMKEELIEILKEKSVRTGHFTLASGKISDFYVDARQTTLNGRGSVLIANLILEQLDPSITAVGGPVTGADPITGSVISLASLRGRELGGFMVRKQAKGHGVGNWVEGLANCPKGSNICVLEDTVTTGGSLLKAVHKLEELGLNVQQCIAVVDREEGARETIEGAGYSFIALTTRSELI